jgi:hypothetical protein
VLIKICWIIFGFLIALLIAAVTPLLGLVIRGDFRNFTTPLGILGALLIVLAAITKMSKLLKGFMLGTGAAVVGWPLSLLLHNFLFRFFPTEPFTYVLFFYVFPAIFITSAIGTIIVGIKQLVTSH